MLLTSTKKSALGLLCALCWVVAFFSVSLSAKESETPSLLTVHGEAVIQVPANQLSLSLGVVANGDTAEDALTKNGTTMNQVIDALKNAGLSAQELRTGQLSLRPIHSRPPKDIPENWQPKVLGFEATNMITITTEKLSIAPKAIDAATKAGANQIQELQFSLSDKQKWRSSVIAQATENAIADAITLTTAAHVKLGRIIELKLDETPAPPRFMMKAMAYGGGNPSTPLEEGSIELRASVTAVYAIH
jgi:uncharacterized protein YggE